MAQRCKIPSTDLPCLSSERRISEDISDDLNETFALRRKQIIVVAVLIQQRLRRIRA